MIVDRAATIGILLCLMQMSCGKQDAEVIQGLPPPLVNSFGMEFRFIPAGSHQVSDCKMNEVGSFYLQTTELTFRHVREIEARRDAEIAYQKYVFDEIGGERPVPIASWKEADELADLLSVLDSQYDYRLPTESEWVYACAAGADVKGDITREAVEDTKPGFGRVAPTKSRPANAFGMFDMLSGFGEYCESNEIDDDTKLVKGMPSESSPFTFSITDRKLVPVTGTEDLLIGVRFVLSRKTGLNEPY